MENQFYNFLELFGCAFPTYRNHQHSLYFFNFKVGTLVTELIWVIINSDTGILR